MPQTRIQPIIPQRFNEPNDLLLEQHEIYISSHTTHAAKYRFVICSGVSTRKFRMFGTGFTCSAAGSTLDREARPGDRCAMKQRRSILVRTAKSTREAREPSKRTNEEEDPRKGGKTREKEKKRRQEVKFQVHRLRLGTYQLRADTPIGVRKRGCGAPLRVPTR